MKIYVCHGKITTTLSPYYSFINFNFLFKIKLLFKEFKYIEYIKKAYLA